VGDVRARGARRVVVATGGRSIPQTGSTGFGYGLAASLGHAVVEPVPALTPLRGRTPPVHAGTTVAAILTVEDMEGRVLRRSAGSLLFTHGGVSGPAALDASIGFRAPCRVRADFWTLADPAGPFGPYLALPKLPGSCLPASPAPTTAHALEREILAAPPKETLGTFLGRRLPRRVVEALAPAHGVPLGKLTREDRRVAAERIAGLDLGITGLEGFDKAEVTAGGVPLRELDRRTLESRLAPGVFFCGEVCHATGRLGGFNFQWAWSSGVAAGRGAAATS
jgi:predicted flavoprotein YhiN